MDFKITSFGENVCFLPGFQPLEYCFKVKFPFVIVIHYSLSMCLFAASLVSVFNVVEPSISYFDLKVERWVHPDYVVLKHRTNKLHRSKVRDKFSFVSEMTHSIFRDEASAATNLPCSILLKMASTSVSPSEVIDDFLVVWFSH